MQSAHIARELHLWSTKMMMEIFYLLRQERELVVGDGIWPWRWIKQENEQGKQLLRKIQCSRKVSCIAKNCVLCFSLPQGLGGRCHHSADHDLSQTQLLEFSLVLLALVSITFGIVAILRSPGFITRLAVRLSSRWAALRNKVYNPQETISSVRQFVTAEDSLGNGKWRHPALGAIANIVFDILTLYFLFVAAGYNINLGVLFAGYGLPFILGKLAFMFPGGVGVIEGSMVAMYESLKVPNDISVVVILGYRLFSFWLPSLLGFVAATYLSSLQRKANSP